MPAPHPADSPRITAVLNCFADDGANRGQLILRADGTLQAFGDRDLTDPALAQLRRGELAPAPAPRRRGQPRKSAPALVAVE